MVDSWRTPARPVCPATSRGEAVAERSEEVDGRRTRPVTREGRHEILEVSRRALGETDIPLCLTAAALCGERGCFSSTTNAETEGRVIFRAVQRSRGAEVSRICTRRTSSLQWAVSSDLVRLLRDRRDIEVRLRCKFSLVEAFIGRKGTVSVRRWELVK